MRLHAGNDAFSGIMFDILPNLFGFIGLNATDYTIYPSPDQSSGYLLPDGSWTGCRLRNFCSKFGALHQVLLRSRCPAGPRCLSI